MPFGLSWALSNLLNSGIVRLVQSSQEAVRLACRTLRHVADGEPGQLISVDGRAIDDVEIDGRFGDG